MEQPLALSAGGEGSSAGECGMGKDFVSDSGSVRV